MKSMNDYENSKLEPKTGKLLGLSWPLISPIRLQVAINKSSPSATVQKMVG